MAGSISFLHCTNIAWMVVCFLPLLVGLVVTVISKGYTQLFRCRQQYSRKNCSYSLVKITIEVHPHSLVGKRIRPTKSATKSASLKSKKYTHKMLAILLWNGLGSASSSDVAGG